jgi:hypothetical protein
MRLIPWAAEVKMSLKLVRLNIFIPKTVSELPSFSFQMLASHFEPFSSGARGINGIDPLSGRGQNVSQACPLEHYHSKDCERAPVFFISNVGESF